MGLPVEAQKDKLEFTDEQCDIWKTLYARQLPAIREYACQEYLEGFDILQLPEDHIPSIRWLNERITPRTGWRTVRTAVRYSNAVQWYAHFQKKNS